MENRGIQADACASAGREWKLKANMMMVGHSTLSDCDASLPHIQ